MTTSHYFMFLAGFISIVGQFWGSNYYLPLIGGILAITTGLAVMFNNP